MNTKNIQYVFIAVSILLMIHVVFLPGKLSGIFLTLVWVGFLMIIDLVKAQIKEQFIPSFFQNCLLTFSILIGSLLVLYFPFGLTPYTAVTSVAIVSLIKYLGLRRVFLYKLNQSVDRANNKVMALVFKFISTLKFSKYAWLALIADAVIVMLALFARTEAAIFSPWNILGLAPFVLFALSTALLILETRLGTIRTALTLGLVHMFVYVSISALIYKIGFGFDPFIHRAAETALLNLGTIEPKTPLYLAQYLLVDFIHLLSGLSIHVIDVWLVPTLGFLFIPLGIYIGLVHGHKIERQISAGGWVLMLIIPASLITFTTPFSFTYLFFLVWIVQLPLLQELTWRRAWLSTSAILMFFHPLIAVPMFIFTAIFEINASRVRTAIHIILTSISIPVLFISYQWLHGATELISQPFSRLYAFFYIFANPFIDRFPNIPWFYDLTYGLRYWLPIALTALAVAIICYDRQKKYSIYGTWMASLMLMIFLVSTMFVFDGIIGHEQQEFALRLLQIFYVSSLPVLIVIFAKRLQTLKKSTQIIFAILIILLLTHSWYFSYPQYNLKYPFFAPSVSAADLEAVNWIQQDAGENQYLVLSNQMTSAAALQEFGFADYIEFNGQNILWYAIPTGGDLYQKFATFIVYPMECDIIITDLFAQTNVDTIYLALHTYWKWSDELLQTLELRADNKHIINQEIIIYSFSYEDQN